MENKYRLIKQNQIFLNRDKFPKEIMDDMHNVKTENKTLDLTSVEQNLTTKMDPIKQELSIYDKEKEVINYQYPLKDDLF